LAEAFDRARVRGAAGHAPLGRSLLVRESSASTNDEAWTALAELGDGVAVIALEQTRGRGRAGRSWQQVPGKGLALSVALHLGCDVRHAGVIPLARDSPSPAPRTRSASRARSSSGRTTCSWTAASSRACCARCGACRHSPPAERAGRMRW
jgi:hypothetical protein